jgi:hypothetical protein
VRAGSNGDDDVRETIEQEALLPLAARRTMAQAFQFSPGCLGNTCLIVTAWNGGAIITFTNVAGFETFNVVGIVNGLFD